MSKLYRIRPLNFEKGNDIWCCRNFHIEQDMDGMYWPYKDGNTLKMYDAEGDEYTCFSTLDAAIECCQSAQANMLWPELEEA